MLGLKVYAILEIILSLYLKAFQNKAIPYMLKPDTLNSQTWCILTSLQGKGTLRRPVAMIVNLQ